MIRAVLAGTALLGLAGCAAPVGDFGRRDGGLYADTVSSLAGPLSPVALGVGSRYDLTDGERELRAVGWDLVRPPDRDVPGNSLAEFRWWRTLPDGFYAGYPQAYWSALQMLPVRSHETRYERVLTQARADAARLPPFRDVATRVGQADGARRNALDAVAADAGMRREAERRIAENRAVVDTVCRALGLRIAAYRYALGRFVVETPSARSVEANAAVDALAWEAGDCGGTVRAASGSAILVTPGVARPRFTPQGGVLEGPAPPK